MSVSPRKRPDVNAQFRAIMDLTLGLMYILVGMYGGFNAGLKDRLGKNTLLGLVILFCIYGVYRIVKGCYTLLRMMKR